MPSMCSLCHKNEENTFHLFFLCPYVIQIWNWFAHSLNCTLQFQSKEDIWSVCKKASNQQCKVVITTALINIFNVFWFARNQARLNDKIVTWRSSVSVISSNSNMAGNLTSKKASSSMYDFTILKKFNVNIHPPNAPKIIKVLWHPPILNWVKCNTDGSATSSSLACGGIFRNNNAQFMLCFSENTGNGNAFFAELSGAMRAIELASQHRWTKLWLECDSAMVVNAFKNNTIVPWKIRNRWENCLALCKSMQIGRAHV